MKSSPAGRPWHVPALLLAGILRSTPAAPAAAYDPLAVPADTAAPATVDLTVKDAERQREIPVLIHLPLTKEPAPVILFSHGLGGSRESYSYLGPHWAARGYVAVFLQHPGSDTAVWENVPPSERLEALRQAMNVQNFLLRNKDVSVVLDQLARWNSETGHALAGRLDLTRVGMSGHSFGAVTTQAVSGERFPIGGDRYTDPRIKAAVLMSPSTLPLGSTAEAFGGVKIPWMLMTGTKDSLPFGTLQAEARLAVYAALPPGGKYELVLQGAEHSAFTDRALPGDQEPRNPNHHRAVLALSTAFWDAYLRADAAAQEWLDGDGPRTVLAPDDRWEKK